MAGILSTEELAGRLGRRNLRLVDTRGGFAAYEEGHLPGAQYLHIETLRMSERGIPCVMHRPETLGAIFGRLGIARETPVVFYASNPLDHLGATYAAWSLAVIGHREFHLLDGHLGKWAAEGREIVRQYPAIRTVQYEAQFDGEIFADWRYVRDRLGDPGVAFVDSRSRSLYTGETGPTMRLGHIPGAVLHNYLWDFDRGGCYQPLERLRARYERKGVTPDKEVITYCITGREGSSNWFILRHLLGYPRVRLYQASLTEWAANPDLPMVTGEEPGEAPARRRRAA